MFLPLKGIIAQQAESGFFIVTPLPRYILTIKNQPLITRLILIRAGLGDLFYDLDLGTAMYLGGIVHAHAIGAKGLLHHVPQLPVVGVWVRYL